jgi:hypothetical protein
VVQNKEMEESSHEKIHTKRHWYKVSEALACADRKWLSRLITRREKPENFKQALKRKPDDIKVVIQFSKI